MIEIDEATQTAIVTALRTRTPYARAGAEVTCEAGHPVARVAGDLPRWGDGTRQNPDPPLHDWEAHQVARGWSDADAMPWRCWCGARYAKIVRRRDGSERGWRLHVRGRGWLGEGRRWRRVAPRWKAATRR